MAHAASDVQLSEIGVRPIAVVTDAKSTSAAVPDVVRSPIDSGARSPSDGSEAAAAAIVPAPSAALNLSEHERKAVEAVYDADKLDYLDAIAAFNDAQMQYYSDTITPDRIRVLSTKGSRVAGDTEAEPEVTLSWKNLSYTKDGEKEPRLHGLTGVLRPRQTVCVLGGSEAGITSLLMVLSGSNQGGVLSGERFLNGAPYDASIRRRIAFVPKDDIHLSHLTLQETLEFAARLRLPQILSDKAKRLRAVNVMKLLGLRHAANTIVGSDTLRGISGGEKRRLSIGVEMVGGQMSLIADLPTNGLDSASAYEMLATYKNLSVHSGRSLMVSLVQPSPELLNVFDSVLLMSAGRCSYFGPRSTIEQHFFGLGYRMPIAGPGEQQKSVPDYLEELSARPERYYKGKTGVTNEKGEVVVRRNIVVVDDGDTSKPGVTVAVQPDAAPASNNGDAMLDDIARRDSTLALSEANTGVRVYVPTGDAIVPPAPLSNGGDAKDVGPYTNGNHNGNRSSNGNGHAVDGAAKKTMGTPRRPRPRISHYEAMQHIILAYSQSAECQSVNADVSAIHASPKPGDPNAYGHNSPLWYQALIVFARQLLLTWRNKATSVGEVLIAIGMGLMIGSLWWDIGTGQKDMRTRFGLFFLILMYQLTNCIGTIPGLMEHRLVYYLQTGPAALYRPAFFYLSYMLAALPVVVASTFAFLFIEYPMSKLEGGVGGSEFGYLGLMVVVTVMVARAWCLLLAALSDSQAYCMALTSITVLLFTLFCGFTVPRDAIPIGWRWLYYLSFFTWSLAGVCQNELVHKTFTCNAGEFLQLSPLSEPVCPISSGMQALAQYNMEPSLNDDGTPNMSEKWTKHMLNMFWFLLSFNVAACIAMSTVNYYKNDASIVAPIDDEDDEPDTDGVTDADAAGKPTATPSERRRKRAAAKGTHAITVVAEPAPVDAAAGKYEMVVTPTTLSFHNLSYRIPIAGQKEPKELLTNTFGFVKPGMMVALMGPSGAGKSTLLDVLANKKNMGSANGSLLINGKQRDASFQLIAGYVEQTDSHNAHSTVREAIEFSARLRLPVEMSDAEKMERVEAVLDKLALRHVQHMQIGSVEHGGISPELRKKVTIGVELVMNPAILFLDEPTTGLDSVGAMAVMDAVRRLAKTISVVCTVHQPSAEIVQKFDYMLLMQKGGRVAYCGPIDSLSAYLGSVGLGECPRGRNIADHALEVAGGGIKLNAVSANGPSPADLFERSPERAAIDAELAALGNDLATSSSKKIVVGEPPAQGSAFVRDWFVNDATAPWSSQFAELTKRFFVSMYRDELTFYGRLINVIMVSFIIGTMYYQLGFSQTDAYNRVSLFFLTVVMPPFSSGEAIPLIITPRPVYFRELQSKIYTPSAYFMARFAGGIPYNAIESVIFSVMIYFIAGLTKADGGSHFWLFMATDFMIRLVGFAMAEWIASLIENGEAATATHGMWVTLMLLFSGFLVPKDSIPVGWSWMYYLSLFRYPLSLLANSELRDLEFNCNGNKGAIGPLPYFNASATNDPFTIACTTPVEQTSNSTCYGYVCPTTNGQQTLASFGIDGESIGGWYGVLVAMTVGYYFISFVTHKKVQHIKR